MMLCVVNVLKGDGDDDEQDEGAEDEDGGIEELRSGPAVYLQIPLYMQAGKGIATAPAWQSISLT